MSPLHGSPDHIALRLKRAGLSVPRVVGVLDACGIGLGLLACAVMDASSGAGAFVLVFSLSTVLLVAGSLLWRTGT